MLNPRITEKVTKGRSQVVRISKSLCSLGNNSKTTRSFCVKRSQGALCTRSYFIFTVSENTETKRFYYAITGLNDDMNELRLNQDNRVRNLKKTIK